MPTPPLCGGTCSSQEQALKDFVYANKACNTTADCQVLSVGCGISFDDGCTGEVYVNQSIDQSKFGALAQAFTACNGTSCVLCERLTLPAACVAGLCQRQSP